MRKKRKTGPRQALQVIRPHVAGIDLGSREHWVCGPPREDGAPNVRTFGSTTRQLHELADWLTSEGVDSVAMESTHVYWIPLHELLEERGFEGCWGGYEPKCGLQNSESTLSIGRACGPKRPRS